MRIFSYVLTFVLIFNLAGAQVAFGQTTDAKRTAKVKKKVGEIGAGGKSTMLIKMLDGRVFKGKISKSDENTFSIVEKNGIETTLSYGDVKSAGRPGLSAGAKVAIFTAIGVGIAIPAIIFGTIYCNEQAC